MCYVRGQLPFKKCNYYRTVILFFTTYSLIKLLYLHYELWTTVHNNDLESIFLIFHSRETICVSVNIFLFNPLLHEYSVSRRFSKYIPMQDLIVYWLIDAAITEHLEVYRVYLRVKKNSSSKPLHHSHLRCWPQKGLYFLCPDLHWRNLLRSGFQYEFCALADRGRQKKTFFNNDPATNPSFLFARTQLVLWVNQHAEFQAIKQTVPLPFVIVIWKPKSLTDSTSAGSLELVGKSSTICQLQVNFLSTSFLLDLLTWIERPPSSWSPLQLISSPIPSHQVVSLKQHLTLKLIILSYLWIPSYIRKNK